MIDLDELYRMTRFLFEFMLSKINDVHFLLEFNSVIHNKKIEIYFNRSCLFLISIGYTVLVRVDDATVKNGLLRPSILKKIKMNRLRH